MRKLWIGVVAVATVALFSYAAYASCGSTVTIQNSSNCVGLQVATGTYNTDFFTKWWAVGASSTMNNGTRTTSLTTCLTNQYQVWDNWGNSGVNGCPGTPPASTSRTAFLYSIANGGSAQYLIMNVAYNSASNNSYDFDAITNGPGNVLNPIAIPAITTGSRVPVTGGADYTLHWTAIANPKGYYDTAPASNILTGIAVYYWNGAGTPTTVADYAITNANWILAAGGPNSRTGYVSFTGSAPDPGVATVFIPSTAPASTYVALGLFFDGAAPSQAAGWYARADFVGHAVAYANPTPAGLFTSVSASAQKKQVTTNWTTNVESGVVAYDVVYSNKKNGPFQVVPGTTATPTGNGSSYSKTFARPRGSDKLFIKVKATMTSGVDEYSNLVVVGGAATRH